MDSLIYWFYEVLLWVDTFFCQVLSILYSFFDVFAGVTEVTYDGRSKYLINVFFEDTPATQVYMYMAMIGIALSFAFAIYAVIKKIFDIDDKVKNSLGGIIGNQFKCILFILLMNFIILIVLRSSSTLMERVVYVFNNGTSKVRQEKIVFTNDDYATMGRVMNTIGNYSINPSYDSRYNINACYNEIREDMLTLNAKGVFDYSYDKQPNSWQYFLTRIANAHNLEKEQNIDEYDEALTGAMTACMEQIAISTSFGPVDSYKNDVEPIQASETPFDALIFLAGTSNAAKNEKYNKNPDIFDPLRYEYVRKGGKSIYDTAQVEGDFDISIFKFDHLAIIILGFVLAKIFLSLCINCVARIFNLMLLYLIAPIFIATTPLDDGEKTKQWSIAFIVQAFGVFGAVFGIRILMMFVTMIFNSKLVLFTEGRLNFFAKLLMVFAVACAIEQASKIVTGILANNAGFQSIQASDVGSAGAGRIIGGAQRLGGKAFGAAKSVLNHTPLGTGANYVASKFANSKLGYVFGTGVGSRAAFDKANEAAKGPKTAESMAKSAESLAKSAKQIAASMGGGDSKSEEKSPDGRKRANSAPNLQRNMSIGSPFEDKKSEPAKSQKGSNEKKPLPNAVNNNNLGKNKK